VTYEDDSNQNLIDITQRNIMHNNDIIGINADLVAAHMTHMTEGADAVLRTMADDANSHIPQEWWMPQNTSGAIEFVSARDEARTGNDAPDPNSVQPGRYVDGVMQEQVSDGSYRAELPEIPEAQDYGNGLGQWANLGSNYSANASIIVDTAEAGRTMVVMGDYHHTDAIFQTNSIISKEHVSMSDGSATQVFSGDDTLTNSAEFAQQPTIYGPVSAYFAGPQWIVDVVDGDYYDVRAVVQTNYLSDNDIVGQQSTSSHYEIQAGGNTLENLTQIVDSGIIQYDLIIVAGAYHGMNVIFQNNILLTESQIAMIAGDMGISQSVQGGSNALSNNATIAHYGGDNFQPMNANLESVVSEIGRGATELGTEYGTYFVGSGGPVHVLYVTGDYYDINAIWQVNITSDINVMAQLVGAPPEGLAEALQQDGGVSQSVIIGHNILANEAVIIDVGSENTHVAGNVYDDAILVQANLLPEVTNTVLAGDVQTLAPELIAFVTEGQDTPQAEPLTTIAAAPHEDPVASVMH